MNSKPSLETFDVLKKLKKDIQEAFHLLNIDAEEQEFDNLQFTNMNDVQDENFMRQTVSSILNNLNEIKHEISYLERPVTHKGHLLKQLNGRYTVQDFELTSGTVCEIMDEDSEWNLTRIEHSGDDYYAVCLGKEVILSDRLCRLRRKV